MATALSTTELGTPLDSKDLLDFHNTLIINLTSYIAPTTIAPGNNSTTEEALYYDDGLNPDVRTFIHVLFILLSSVVFLAGIIGNCLVWFAVWRNPRMRSATNMFLVNLAVADFLVVLICLPPTVAEDITGMWYLGREMCKIIKCLQKLSVFVSVMTLTSISMERWMAICRPLFFRPTTMIALRTIVIIWIISLVCNIHQAIFVDLKQINDSQFVCVPSWSEEAESINLWISFTAFYLVPLTIMTFTYVKIALCLWRSGLPDADNDEASANVPRAQLLLRRKKAKMLIMVVAVFALCFLPVYVLFILMYTNLMEYFPYSSIKPLFLTSHWLVSLSSAVNPMIYNFMSCNFRREFLIACHICCRRGSNHNSVYEELDSQESQLNITSNVFPSYSGHIQIEEFVARFCFICPDDRTEFTEATAHLQNHISQALKLDEGVHDIFPKSTVRMRKFHKFQNRRQQHRTYGRNGVTADTNSMTLQTQSSVLGNMASSSYSLCNQPPQLLTPQHHQYPHGSSSNSLYVPRNNAGGCGDGDNISTCSSRRSSPSGSMRNQVLQKNHIHNM